MQIQKFLAMCMLLTAAPAFGQGVNISGTLDWEKMQIQAIVSLDLSVANIRLPSGRIQAESIISSQYLQLLRSVIMEIQADSSSTLEDYVQRGGWSHADADKLCLNARSISPYLSTDFSSMKAAYFLSLNDISSALQRHKNPVEIRRTLNPVPAQAYTGIVIIASSPLPVHGMKSSASLVPCLFPKIWDSDMNLIFEKNMLKTSQNTMVRYAPQNSIFQNNPSGLSAEIIPYVGDKPLRIIARGLFGDTPTDLIIDTQDAMQIISTEENRRLLQEGKVLIIVDESALKAAF